MFDLPILTAICAILVTFAALCVDFIQTRSIRKINLKVEAFQQQDIGEAFGNWLLKRQKVEGSDEEITNFVVLARGVGHEIARSFSMAAKGIASGESRTIRSVEKAVLEGLRTPETSALLGFCDQIGVDRELAGTVLQVLETRGLLPKVLGQHQGQGNGGTNWG